MKILIRIINSISYRLKILAERLLIGKVDKEIFNYSDCLTTVRKINSYYKASRLCDIGAYKGNWSFVMHQLNPDLESIVMFEPQELLIESLRKQKLKNVEKNIYHCALGNKNGQLTLKGGTSSASLYESSNNQNYYFPGSINQEAELVEVKVLDEIYETDGLDFPDLIKMDVQGYELNVLKGAVNVLNNARYLVIELGLREFYKGQPPIWELFKYLEDSQYMMIDHGFELRSPNSPHELLQFDAIFVNKRFEHTK